jgi:hypothetical protein
VGDEEGSCTREDEGVGGEAEEAGAVAAVGDVRSGDGGGGSDWRDDREEEARFFVWEDGVEDEVANAGD